MARKKQKVKAFVDTNIWFSALYKKGLPYKAILLCFEKGYEIVISQQVLEEIFGVLKRKYPQGISLLKQIFLQINPTIFKNPSLQETKRFSRLASPEDLPLLTAALKYHCHYFITGNIKDFAVKKIKKNFKMSVVTSRQFTHQEEV